MTILDAHLSRPLEGGPSFSLGNRLFRAVWRIAWRCLASWTPPAFRGWRRGLLVAFGARLAPSADVRSSARIWYPPHLSMGAQAVIGPEVVCYNIAPVEIGCRTIVSQRAHLCTGSHDLSDRHFQLVARSITLEDDVWIAAEAFVGPGVVAREGSVLAARGAIFGDLQPWTVYRGNPAQPVKTRKFRPAEQISTKSAPQSRELFEPQNPIWPWDILSS
ncbi:putative colanic acid biosynthesis acetyltransferase [Lichenifustis flavocetrariae]|uniref:Colanic acid biosynthesis acetyltransferase n=1 Tax=Lichenifustis flavocetrariae TaxID=2949735 RepID=A0AA41YSV2_9HYPH|nr:putative colanic acid biosynthesis acetyltransferase [Lichenifustis flavocetrariae]MCW6506566.1 putative colanic acid biosynthesis acetyltransferase [Lichenifustis flavocetrariae]